MKRFLCTFVFLTLISLFVSGQAYENAVGIRAGYSSGLVLKHFINRDFAIEAQALYNKNGFQLSAMYAYQFSPYRKERLQYYFGAGPFGGNWGDEFSLGVAAYAGAEFVFRKAPVIMGIEWKPGINVYKVLDYAIPDIALTFKVKLN